ncbi:MAG TPA: endolytic transglycosylase MltG [Ktedonobacteraceae bacterium]|nr:endolytic transglycosylase MltG [Ktedonobacteraceae bacterium]
MKRRSHRGGIVAVLIIGLLVFGLSYFAYNTAVAIFQPVNSVGQGHVVPIRITQGETAAQIAVDLQQKGLIRNALAFRIWARIKGLDTKLQSGGYTHLNTSMTISDIVDELLNGQPDVLYVTIPEGYRIEQIAQAFAGVGLAKFNAQQFVDYAKHPSQFPDASKYPVLKMIPRGDSMEGLLFPATYQVPVDGDARLVMNQMLTAFNTYVAQANLVAKARENGLNEYQMVILASLVQREIANIKDAPGVAGVYYNRFENKIPNDTAGYLGSDPSVEYARDTANPPQQYWQNLQDSGRNVDPGSPWNTYTHQGLPPTPICSPGVAVMTAAASPTKSNYFYFLSTNKGTIVYATNYAQFQQLVQQYLH